MSDSSDQSEYIFYLIKGYGKRLEKKAQMIMNIRRTLSGALMKTGLISIANERHQKYENECYRVLNSEFSES